MAAPHHAHDITFHRVRPRLYHSDRSTLPAVTGRRSIPPPEGGFHYTGIGLALGRWRWRLGIPSFSDQMPVSRDARWSTRCPTPHAEPRLPSESWSAAGCHTPFMVPGMAQGHSSQAPISRQPEATSHSSRCHRRPSAGVPCGEPPIAHRACFHTHTLRPALHVIQHK